MSLLRALLAEKPILYCVVWRQHYQHLFALRRCGLSEIAALRERERLAREALPVDGFDALCQETIDNVKCRVAKTLDVVKVLNHVRSLDQLGQAEEVLISFNRSLNVHLPSLALAVARACDRLGLPETAMGYIRDVEQYGLFPTVTAYLIIMEGMLAKNNPKGALSVFDYMTSHGIPPTGQTLQIAAKAACYVAISEFKATKPQLESTEEKLEGEAEEQYRERDQAELDLSHTMELCWKCSLLRPSSGVLICRSIFAILVKEGMVDQARSLLADWEREEALPRHTLFGLNFNLHRLQGDLYGAVGMLNELCSHENQKWKGIEGPQRGMQWLQEDIEQSQDEILKQSFEKIKTQLQGIRANTCESIE